MCELLGMSANVPTDIVFSFSGLIRRGGATGPHSDGWGIAFYEGRGCRAFHDPVAGANSEIAELVRHYPIKSRTVISHIRKANRGRVCLENTHPFLRELWGRTWCFAHNGQLSGIKKLPLEYFHPVGTSDSEFAFCWLLDRLRRRFGATPPSQGKLTAVIRDCLVELSDYGVFNVLLSDSRQLLVHCSTRLTWITREAPFGRARLVDSDMAVDFSQLTSPGDVVSVIATDPLTHDERWTPMSPGESLVFRAGRPHKIPTTRP
ncbi:MAG: class II glutamine amidotransferase [Pseudomonadota bacterium]|nr:class II glutamine amidotransferase [Pseudomonadota bacterium]